MKYRETRDVSGRLTIELEEFPLLAYRWTAWRIARKFALRKNKDSKQAGHIKTQKYNSPEGVIGIEWDNWTGLTVVAFNSESEILVKNIGEYLENKFT